MNFHGDRDVCLKINVNDLFSTQFLYLEEFNLFVLSKKYSGVLFIKMNAASDEHDIAQASRFILLVYFTG